MVFGFAKERVVTGVPLFISHFSHAAFKILSLTFDSLIICLGMDLLSSPWLKFFELLGVRSFPLIWDVFSHCFFR